MMSFVCDYATISPVILEFRIIDVFGLPAYIEDIDEDRFAINIYGNSDPEKREAIAEFLNPYLYVDIEYVM